MDSYFIFHNISLNNTNKINTTQGENKFTSNQHYHYLHQTKMSNNPSDKGEETHLAEVKVDEMETITASVEEVRLSENTPEEKRQSTSTYIYYSYMTSKPKNVQIILRFIHPGSSVTTDYTKITNTHNTSATSEIKTPTKEFEATPGKEKQGLLFSLPAVLPELSARSNLDYQVKKKREGKAKSSRRKKLRNQDQEGYAASLDKERTRRYLWKKTGGMKRKRTFTVVKRKAGEITY